jgi:MtfA peptidase
MKFPGFLARLREGKRNRILAERPIADEVWAWALKEHRILSGLDAGEVLALRELTTLFLADKVFYPVRGLELEEDMKVSIAVQACLPILKLGLDWYRGWSSVIVTPEEFSITRKDVDTAGVVHEYEDELSGQVLDLGPVVFSWKDVEASGWGDGYNVVIHEMAHKLDERDGDIDGCPPLGRDMSRADWRDAFTAAFEDLTAALERPASGKRHGKRKPRIDEYAAESPPEFFAVVCEYFFERPLTLKNEYPAVYEQLRLFFKQDPGARV